MNRDLCVVAIRAFGFYPLFWVLYSSSTLLQMVLSDQSRSMELSAELLGMSSFGHILTTIVPTVLGVLLGLVCIFFAPWIACRLYGPPESESGSEEPITIEPGGVLRAGIALLGLWVIAQLIEPCGQLVAYVVVRESDAPMDHAALTPIFAEFGCTVVMAAVLLLRAGAIARALERLWSDTIGVPPSTGADA